jgi:RNA polymerase sigma-70 factor (ECF subfamily)
MAQTPSFDDLLAHLRQRDDAAAAEVFNRFRDRLLGLARKHLNSRVRPKVDADDVVQSVFQTVFRRLADGQFELDGWNGLWGLLTCITVRRCGRWQEYFHTGARDVGREAPALPAGNSSFAGLEAIDREPAPEEAVALAETVEQVLHGLEENERRIVVLSLEGRTVAEVSAELSCTDSKVYRVLRHVRRRLERMRDGTA